MALSSISIQSQNYRHTYSDPRNRRYIIFYSNRSLLITQWFSTESNSTHTEFSGGNAYDILGISEDCSFSEIKSSFRKLAKETHPDLVANSSNNNNFSSSAASHRFVQILAAYEILSDSERRAHYDNYLKSQRKVARKECEGGSVIYTYESRMGRRKEMEVVEWLKWYRLAINDILSEKKLASGTGYFDVLEADFYSAIHAAYYGPEILSMDLLPDRFEAEERSVCETPEVLHLVSGRDLFGMVCLANKVPELISACTKRLNSATSVGLGIFESIANPSTFINDEVNDGMTSHRNINNKLSHTSDAYHDLELHVEGKVVAMATRVPPKSRSSGVQNEDIHDQIHVFLNSHDNSKHNKIEVSWDSSLGGEVAKKIPLGTILGLGTSPEEGSCYVYDRSGKRTHVIMKHRTFLVKHMHWYPIEDKVSICECRCSRARLPPSKFWLFEPRCYMHDVGGWYVETFGKDKKGRTVPSQRHWDGFDGSVHYEKTLHPAMYLLALAYRSLDIEDAKRRKRTFRGTVEGQLFRILHWCKKLV